MKRLIVCVLATVIGFGMAQGAVLDQAQVDVGGRTTVDVYGSSYVQTFTCGITGRLDHVDLHVQGPEGTGDPGYPTTVAIVSVEDGAPIWSTLGQLDSCIFELGWNSLDFSSQSVYLTAGTQYGIMLANDDTDVGGEPTLELSFDWGHDGDPYVGGKLWKGDPGNWQDDWVPEIAPIDGCFRTYMAPQPTIALAVDIKPGSCPNPLNVKCNGVLPVAVLGTQELNVTSIDVASVRLAGAAAVRSSFEDVATPAPDASECVCSTEGPDGYTDLTLKFKTWEIAEAVAPVIKGDTLTLTLTAALADGSPVRGSDCVMIVGNVPAAVTARKADMTGDGAVNMLDLGTVAQYWLEACIIDY
ncbi:MAG: hypothetical protein ACYTBJ_23955 [Planctomycetota bacterium]|jgi:hypothetical protein